MVRLLAFGEAFAIRAGAALTLHQGFARLASVMYAADIVSIGSQWLLRWVAPGWSAKNTRRKVNSRPTPVAGDRIMEGDLICAAIKFGCQN